MPHITAVVAVAEHVVGFDVDVIGARVYGDTSAK
jgi:hypothetical protein